ncbi:MAG: hypothetical protein C4527_25205 [Candidatus Omnitrophota bacterium]|nr:MAG: hypothetical protein C4527_25205 [Candidatus Omnitrophota bacterium]
MFRKIALATITAGIALGLTLVATDSHAQGRGQKGIRVLGGQQTNFVDADGNGICDLRGSQNRGPNFTDANNDGICDLQMRGRGNRGNRGGNGMQAFSGAGRGYRRGQLENAPRRNFVDADGDGVCDNPGPRQGRGFVDADQDGINDNSPLASLALTPEQKAQVVQLRTTGPGPHTDEVLAILTDEQKAQFEELRSQRQDGRLGLQQRQRRGMRMGYQCPVVTPEN